VVPAENAGNSRPGMQTQVQRERGERLGPASSAAASLSGHEQEAEAEAEGEGRDRLAVQLAGSGSGSDSRMGCRSWHISSLTSHLLSLASLVVGLLDGASSGGRSVVVGRAR